MHEFAMCASNSRYTVDFLKELLGVEVGETTKDGLFTLLEGNALGPVLTLQYYIK